MEIEIEKVSCDLNFTSFPVPNNKILPVDFGVDSIGNITINRDNEVEILTRSSIPSVLNKSKFVVSYPSLPLSLPNKRTYYNPEKLIHKKTRKGWYNQDMTSACHNQYNLLAKDYGVFLHSSLYHASDSAIHQDISSFIDKQSLGHFLRYYDKSDDKKRSLYNKSMFRSHRKGLQYKNAAALSDLLTDIPSNLLRQHLDESLFHDYDNHRFNYNIRNCVQHYSINDQTYILCPRGELLNILTVYKLCDAGGNDSLKLHETAATTLSYTIKNIKLVNETLSVKGDFHLTMFQMTLNGDNIALEQKYHSQFDECIHDICLNDFNTNNFFAVGSNGVIGSERSCTIKPLIHSESNDWHSCIYGSSQQTCLVSDQFKVALYDFRMSNTPPTIHIELPCKYFARYENISPILTWSSHDPYAYYFGTTHALVLCDERYLKTPTLKIHHYMESPPRYISSTALADETHLIVLGDYIENESVCMQLVKNGFCDIAIGENKFMKCNNPLTIRQPIFKLSSYKDWGRHVSDWRFTESRTNERLNSPSIGMTVCPLPSSSHCSPDENYCFVQANLFGDLFYQRLSYKRCDHEEGVRSNEGTNLNVIVKPYVHTEDMFTKISGQYKDIRELNQVLKIHCTDWLNEMESQCSENKDENLNENVTLFNGASLFNGIKQKISSVVTKEEISSKKDYHDQNPRPYKNDETNVEGSVDKIAGHVTRESKTMFPNFNGSITNENETMLSDFNEATNENETLLPGFNEATNENETMLTVFNEATKEKLIGLIRSENTPVLTRKSLNLETIPKRLNLVENVDRYLGKPLSNLLYSNWHNVEDSYITLDTVAPYTLFDPSLDHHV